MSPWILQGDVACGTHSNFKGEELTKKQKSFVYRYIVTGDAVDAVLRSYDCSSRNSARVIAHKLLHNEKVKKFLEESLKMPTKFPNIRLPLEVAERCLLIIRNAQLMGLKGGGKHSRKNLLKEAVYILNNPIGCSPAQKRLIPIAVLKAIVDSKGIWPEWWDLIPEGKTHINKSDRLKGSDGSWGWVPAYKRPKI